VNGDTPTVQRLSFIPDISTDAAPGAEISTPTGALTTNTGGAFAQSLKTNSVERIGISGAGAVVVNETGADADFRVESDTSTHMIFVDASTNRVGINQSSPQFTLDVVGDVNVTSDIGAGGVVAANGEFTDLLIIPTAVGTGFDSAISFDTGDFSLKVRYGGVTYSYAPV
jgi:hypothetical protein